MIPTSITRLETMPLMPSGKVDRQALPRPEPATERARPDLPMAHVAPRNGLERYLVEVWEEVLGVSGIGIHDPFLELGGDSVRAMRVANRLQPLLGDYGFVTALFETQAIGEFARYLREAYVEAVRGLDREGDPGVDEVEALVALAERLPEEEIQRLLGRRSD
jgi:aryl carrier-like protein